MIVILEKVLIEKFKNIVCRIDTVGSILDRVEQDIIHARSKCSAAQCDLKLIKIEIQKFGEMFEKEIIEKKG